MKVAECVILGIGDGRSCGFQKCFECKIKAGRREYIAQEGTYRLHRKTTCIE